MAAQSVEFVPIDAPTPPTAAAAPPNAAMNARRRMHRSRSSEGRLAPFQLLRSSPAAMRSCGLSILTCACMTWGTCSQAFWRTRASRSTWSTRCSGMLPPHSAAPGRDQSSLHQHWHSHLSRSCVRVHHRCSPPGSPTGGVCPGSPAHIIGGDFAILARNLVLDVVRSGITGVSRIENRLSSRF